MQKNSSSFPVEVTSDPFGASEALAKVLAGGRTLIVADTNVIQRQGGLGVRIGRYFQDHALAMAASPVVLAGGEKVKSDALDSVRRVIRAALEAKIGRTDAIVALGGGTILDVAGYAAAQVRGGVRLVRLPTTPGAMLDAAFASGASVNCGGIKDALRVPCLPAAVVIDPSFALTVMDGVWNGGLAEAVRFAAVRDAALLKKIAKNVAALKSRDLSAFTALVTSVAAARVKKGDTNFAQWSAARLESMSDFRLPHGYAVAIGVALDCAYAAEKGLLKGEDRDTVVRLLSDFGAMDGLRHSSHLIGRADSLLRGLDAISLMTGVPTVTMIAGLGKSCDEAIDREIMQKAARTLLEPRTPNPEQP